jgi:hypothetical protein
VTSVSPAAAGRHTADPPPPPRARCQEAAWAAVAPAKLALKATTLFEFGTLLLAVISATRADQE